MNTSTGSSASTPPVALPQGQTTLRLEAGVATIVFDRPHARNAMTWTMYEQLVAIASRLRDDAAVRAVVFRGAGGEAFVAGTDIEQFTEFSTGEDGLGYEHRIEGIMEVLESLPMPTVALIETWAVGGGLAIASACDFRIATTGSRFGAPIARTLGNCLSGRNVARLCGAFGPARVKRMLMLAEFMDAPEALACGYLYKVCEPAELDQVASDLVSRLTSLAPITQRVSKEAIRRVGAQIRIDDEDLVRLTYSSADFREGVRAFVDKRKPVWTGR